MITTPSELQLSITILRWLEMHRQIRKKRIRAL